MVYKSLNGLVPTYLQSIFTDRSIITQYELRDTVGKLAVPLPRTNYLKNSFSYQGAVLWNSLPPDLRQTQTLNGFRMPDSLYGARLQGIMVDVFIKPCTGLSNDEYNYRDSLQARAIEGIGHWLPTSFFLVTK